MWQVARCKFLVLHSCPVEYHPFPFKCQGRPLHSQGFLCGEGAEITHANSFQPRIPRLSILCFFALDIKLQRKSEYVFDRWP
jgi:hypothetical protein